MSHKTSHKSQSEPATRTVQKAIADVYNDPENWLHVLHEYTVIGVSGGLDSVVLAHALITHTPAQIASIAIAHFDHGLRPDSSQDADFVQELAKTWKVPFYKGIGKVRDVGYGIESAAREVRYAFLLQAAYEFSPTDAPANIALAHHMDDLAETVLLHLVHGAGLDGLSSMRSFTNSPFDHWVTIARPLLRVRKHILLKYAQENRLDWREDSTNLDLQHARNYVRHIVIPAIEALNPSVIEGLARWSRTLWIDRQRLERDGYPWAEYYVELEFGIRVLLPLNKLDLHTSNWPEWIGRMRAAMRRAFGGQIEIGVEHYERIVRKLAQAQGVSGPHPLPGDLNWSVILYAPIKGEPVLALSFHKKGQLPWMPYGPWLDKVAQRELPKKLEIPGKVLFENGWSLNAKIVPASKFNPKRLDPETGWIDADTVGDLIVATAKVGAKMAPIGMDGHTRALGDIFTDRKVLPALRPEWPVIVDANSGEIVWLTWIAGAERTKITPDSKQAIHLRWKGPPRDPREMRGELFE